jgi:hypothetical protein
MAARLQLGRVSRCTLAISMAQTIRCGMVENNTGGNEGGTRRSLGRYKMFAGSVLYHRSALVSKLVGLPEWTLFARKARRKGECSTGAASSFAGF